MNFRSFLDAFRNHDLQMIFQMISRRFLAGCLSQTSSDFPPQKALASAETVWKRLLEDLNLRCKFANHKRRTGCHLSPINLKPQNSNKFDSNHELYHELYRKLNEHQPALTSSKHQLQLSSSDHKSSRREVQEKFGNLATFQKANKDLAVALVQ